MSPNPLQSRVRPALTILAWAILALPAASSRAQPAPLSPSPEALPALEAETVRLTDEEMIRLLALNRGGVVSGCEQGYPRVVVDILLSPAEENAIDVPKTCHRRRAYVGIASCGQPSRRRVYRLPDRCGWVAGGPGGFGGIAVDSENIQPAIAKRGKSAAIGLRSFLEDRDGRLYQETASVLVSFEGLKVTLLRRRFHGPARRR